MKHGILLLILIFGIVACYQTKSPKYATNEQIVSQLRYYQEQIPKLQQQIQLIKETKVQIWREIGDFPVPQDSSIYQQYMQVVKTDIESMEIYSTELLYRYQSHLNETESWSNSVNFNTTEPLINQGYWRYKQEQLNKLLEKSRLLHDSLAIWPVKVRNLISLGK